MHRFTYEILHVPGKELNTADTLSRAPLPSTANDRHLEELAELTVVANIDHLPASKEYLETYRQGQHSYATCSTLMKYCRDGWPDKHTVAQEFKSNWQARGELTLGEYLLLYGGRVVVPKTMQAETLQKLHRGHQGIQRCRLSAIASVWWPGISREIDDFISCCPQCCRDTRPAREPLITSPLPDYPWQKVATDLFELNGKI